MATYSFLSFNLSLYLKIDSSVSALKKFQKANWKQEKNVHKKNRDILPKCKNWNVIISITYKRITYKKENICILCIVYRIWV